MPEATLDDINAQLELNSEVDEESTQSLRESISATLSDVVKRIKSEGDLTRNRGVHSFKSLKESILGNDLKKEEERRESEKLLGRIADGIEDGNEEDKANNKKDNKSGGGGQKNIMSSLMESIKGIGAAIGISKLFPTKLTDKFTKFFKFLPKLSKLALPLTIAIGLFNGIVDSIKGYKEGGIMGAIEGMFIGIYDGIVGDLAMFVGSMLEKLLTSMGLGDLGIRLNESLSGYIQSIRDYISGFITAFGALFSGDSELFKEGMTQMWDSIKGMFTNLWAFVETSLETFFVGLPKFFDETIWPVLVDFFHFLAPKIEEMFFNALGVIKDFTIDVVIPGIKKMIIGFGDLVESLFFATIAAIKAMAPGGESPSEAFQRVLNEKMESNKVERENFVVKEDRTTVGEVQKNFLNMGGAYSKPVATINENVKSVREELIRAGASEEPPQPTERTGHRRSRRTRNIESTKTSSDRIESTKTSSDRIESNSLEEKLIDRIDTSSSIMEKSVPPTGAQLETIQSQTNEMREEKSTAQILTNIQGGPSSQSNNFNTSTFNINQSQHTDDSSRYVRS